METLLFLLSLLRPAPSPWLSELHHRHLQVQLPPIWKLLWQPYRVVLREMSWIAAESIPSYRKPQGSSNKRTEKGQERLLHTTRALNPYRMLQQQHCWDKQLRQGPCSNCSVRQEEGTHPSQQQQPDSEETCRFCSSWLQDNNKINFSSSLLLRQRSRPPRTRSRQHPRLLVEPTWLWRLPWVVWMRIWSSSTSNCFTRGRQLFVTP